MGVLEKQSCCKGEGDGLVEDHKKIGAVSKGWGVPTKAVWMGKVSFLVAEFCRSMRRPKKINQYFSNVAFRQKSLNFRLSDFQTFYFIFKLLIKIMKI